MDIRGVIFTILIVAWVVLCIVDYRLKKSFDRDMDTWVKSMHEEKSNKSDDRKENDIL